jgi:hypothetical protein
MAYDKAVEAMSAAEGKVSNEEYEALEAATSTAYDDVMLGERALVIVGPKSRQGLIRVAQYLAMQFTDLVGCHNGCPYMPDDINGKPWRSCSWLLWRGTFGRWAGIFRTKQKSAPAKAEPSAGQSDDAYRDSLAAFGKLDAGGKRAMVSYLQTQI